MRVHQYEKAFLWLGAIMLVAFMAALIAASVTMGMRLPGRAGEVDPLTINSVEPFNNPGVRKIGKI